MEVCCYCWTCSALSLHVPEVMHRVMPQARKRGRNPAWDCNGGSVYLFTRQAPSKSLPCRSTQDNARYPCFPASSQSEGRHPQPLSPGDKSTHLWEGQAAPCHAEVCRHTIGAPRPWRSRPPARLRGSAGCYGRPPRAPVREAASSLLRCLGALIFSSLPWLPWPQLLRQIRTGSGCSRPRDA